MTGDALIGDGKKFIMVGAPRIQITEPIPIQPVFVDLITEVRIGDGFAAITLASGIADGDSEPEARTVVRIRIPVGVLANLQAIIARKLQALEQPKEHAN